MHVIEEAFGKNCNLYTDVLAGCSKDANAAALRKSYYRTALKYHPDKIQPPVDAKTLAEANQKFHAITAAYQILCDTELRKEYDITGIIPDAANDDDDVDEFNGSDGTTNPWKAYFDRIFGKVSVSDIDTFASKYKCSDEERRDVLKQFSHHKGDLNKMILHVMLSEPVDAVRWVEDYIQPAIDNDALTSAYSDTMNRTLQQLQQKVVKKKAKSSTQKRPASKSVAREEEDDEDDFMERDSDDDEHDFDDDEETETEEELDKGTTPPKASSSKKKDCMVSVKNLSPKKKSQQPKVAPKVKRGDAILARKTKEKSKIDSSRPSLDLISQIQNRNSNAGRGNGWSNFGARYGVTIADNDEDDPIPDETTFQNVQSKMKNNQNKNKKKKA